MLGGIGVLLVVALVVWQMADVTNYHGVSLVPFWHVSQMGFLAYYSAYTLLLLKCGYELRNVTVRGTTKRLD